MVDRRKAMAASIIRWSVAAAAVMIILLYIPAPFVIYQPGLTERANALVRHSEEGALERADGEWLITTVYMARRTNYWTAMRSMWRTDREVHSRKQVLKGNSIAQYAERMNVLMAGSQSHAIEAAYRAMHVPYAIKPEALLVAGLVKEGEGASPFRTGDRIAAVGGTPVTGAEDTLRELQQYAGKQAAIDVLRSGKSVQLQLMLPEAADDVYDRSLLPKLLGGVELTETRAIVPEEPSQRIVIDAGEVGGPSAGLLFALYICDWLTAGDLTGGKRVVATGTIDPAGNVGAVGGIGMKVIAAEQAGADMIIVPAGNDKKARDMAEAIGSRMRIVPVRTLQEAIAALG